jgi:beta-glucosidase
MHLSSSAKGLPFFLRADYDGTMRLQSIFFGPCFVLLTTCLAACGPQPEPAKPATLEERVETLIQKMTLEEKIAQMHGKSIAPINGLWPTQDDETHGIPGFKMVDGPRGVRAGKATTFPVGMARGATWDPELEKRVGRAIGLETAAKGGNVILAPTINVLRHPRWGRAQETYGEDTFHIGEMGVGFIQGAQEHVIASAKHFAANSIENTRYTVDVQIDERTLREVYTPQFEKAVKIGHVGSVMSAYNRVNGHYCAENEHLLRDILKNDWAFDGFVESDWVFGTRSTTASALAGLDVEMPIGAYYGPLLVTAVQNGEVPESVIDEAVRRILRKKFEFHLDEPVVVDPTVVESAEHVALAREVAAKSMVLLRNEAKTLPLDVASTKKIAVIGALANTINLGDTGSSNTVPSYAVTPLDGLKARGGSIAITYVPGPTISAAEEMAITEADAAIVVVGLTAADEGEAIEGVSAGDRKFMGLRDEDIMLIENVKTQSAKTIVVLEGGSAITVEPWIQNTEAVIMAWYPGQEGGNALADLLFGDVIPSGKLPLTVPIAETQLPPFVNDSDAVTYGYFHGYRHIDNEKLTPSFPFGFGLSYTTFAYSDLRLETPTVDKAGKLVAHVDVTNTGERAGEEVVELYIAVPMSAAERAPKELRAFSRVALDPGQKKTVDLTIRGSELAYWDETKSTFVVEPTTYEVWVGSSSRDLPLSATFTITQ